jgi:hypothetical protein
MGADIDMVKVVFDERMREGGEAWAEVHRGEDCWAQQLMRCYYWFLSLAV